MNNFITNLILVLGILVLSGAIWFLWLEILRQRRRRPKRLKIGNAHGASRTKKQTTAPYDPPTKRYLIQLLHGDRQAVERLMDSARARQPGKPECWYAEKVLHDLERDRR